MGRAHARWRAGVNGVAGGSGLTRRLTRRDLVVYGLLFIGPLAPVGVYGVLDARTDGAVALVYVVATVAMAFTAWSYAVMSRAVPHAGSVFAYASRGLGSTAGFFAGCCKSSINMYVPISPLSESENPGRPGKCKLPIPSTSAMPSSTPRPPSCSPTSIRPSRQ